MNVLQYEGYKPIHQISGLLLWAGGGGGEKTSQ